MVLGQVDDIVQVAGGLHHQRIGMRMIFQQDLRGFPYAVQMMDVVRAIVLRVGAGDCDQARGPVACVVGCAVHVQAVPLAGMTGSVGIVPSFS